MSQAREEILGRVRAALTAADGADGAAGDVDVPRDYGRTLPPGTDLVALVAERIGDYRATVRRVRREELPAAVAELCRDHDRQRVAVPADLPESWLPPAGPPAVVRDDGTLTAPDLDRVDAVVTGCALAVAETGTLVLDGGTAQGRRALSLVPDHHVCVVHADQVVGTVPEAVERLDPARPQTWVSGPSATSDIELNRVEGVHGPRILSVLLVDP